MIQPNPKQVTEFLKESNAIESEYSDEALEDAEAAWKYTYNRGDQKLSLDFILKIHKLLARRLRPDIAGKIRDVDVMVGGRPCPSFYKVEGMLRQWIIDFNSPYHDLRVKKIEQYTKAMHIDFEKIHPFEDFNGRVGRCLYNLHRLRLDLPLHIIHEGDEQMKYYAWFREDEIIDQLQKLNK